MIAETQLVVIVDILRYREFVTRMKGEMKTNQMGSLLFPIHRPSCEGVVAALTRRNYNHIIGTKTCVWMKEHLGGVLSVPAAGPINTIQKLLLP